MHSIIEFFIQHTRGAHYQGVFKIGGQVFIFGLDLVKLSLGQRFVLFVEENDPDALRHFYRWEIMRCGIMIELSEGEKEFFCKLIDTVQKFIAQRDNVKSLPINRMILKGELLINFLPQQREMLNSAKFGCNV